jgi:hypothetical protein
VTGSVDWKENRHTEWWRDHILKLPLQQNPKQIPFKGIAKVLRGGSALGNPLQRRLPNLSQIGIEFLTGFVPVLKPPPV